MSFVSSVNLFVKSIGLIEFDILVSEQHEQSIQLTEYPVESGAPITDHLYRNNNRLTLTVAHSLVPFRANNKEPSDTMRLVDFYGLLYGAMDNGELFTIYSGVMQYDNMAIVGLSTIKDKNTATILQVVIILREVQVVSLNTIEDFKTRYSNTLQINKRASKTVNTGKKQPEDITDTKEEKDARDSILFSLTNKIREAIIGALQ